MDQNNIYLQEALKKCHIYLWTWDNVESIMKMRFPTLNNMNYEDSDQVTIDKLLEIIYSEDITKLQFITGNETGKLRDEISLDIRLKHPDGKFMWYEFRGNTVYNEKGDIIKIGGVALCNNKRILNHKSDLKIKDSEIESEKIKSAFLTGVTHELRSPLQSIIGFSEVLLQLKSVEEQANCIEAIKRNNEILIEILGTVTETDNEPSVEILNETEFTVWEYMVELQQIYALKIQRPVRLVFTNKYDDTQIYMDKERLGQIFDNLLNNSIKTTASGYISYGYEISDNKLTIIVNDTGSGFSRETLNNLYNISSANEIDSTDNYLLSLTICRSMIKKLNGELTVNSTPGAGSSFIIEIPIRKNESISDDSQEEKDADIKEKNEIIIDNSLPTILIAEDVMYSYMMMKTVLEDKYNVIHAENGLVAVEMFKKYNPVFIFMDIKMPEMDGLEATRQIRRLSETVPVVILTAYAVRSLKKEASDVGCTDILTKPTTSKQINATIRKHLK